MILEALAPKNHEAPGHDGPYSQTYFTRPLAEVTFRHAIGSDEGAGATCAAGWAAAGLRGRCAVFLAGCGFLGAAISAGDGGGAGKAVGAMTTGPDAVFRLNRLGNSGMP